MSKTYIKSDEFIQLALENDCDEYLIVSALKSLGKSSATTTAVRTRLSNYRRKGLLPLDSGNAVDIGSTLKATSTHFDSDGNILSQWVKTDVGKADQLAQYEQAIADIAATVTPATPVPSPSAVENMCDLLTVIPIGDAHVGLFADSGETGDSYGLESGKQRLLSGMQLIVDQALPTDTAYIIDVGDFYHADNSSNRTARGNNPLDVDGRYCTVLQTGLEIATSIVTMALKKHQTVRWRSAIGNHNETSALMVNMYVKAYFKDEPRVIVHDSPSMFDYYKFGRCLIGVTHGHTAKADKLGEIMAVDAKEHWSETDHRYFYTGHIHHQSVKEYTSCVVETFRTLASKDAWHASMGYRSGQDLKSITLHKQHGEVTRNTVNISLIE